MGMMQPKPRTTADVGYDEQEQVVLGRHHTETPVSLLANQKTWFFAASPFLFRHSSRINITVPSRSV